MLRLGNLKLNSSLILAPMAGISDLPFRLINRRFGCELAFVEMINARSLSYKSKKTKNMLSSCPEDSPLGVQILGCESKFILKALEILTEYKIDLLDFNAACPAKKVTRRGEGASLLKEPKKLNKLLKIIVKNSRVPVTVKIRSGWDKNSINATEVALYAQDAGISGLFIHGRSKDQGYSGKVDYEVIREVKSALSIPVIASGDIWSAELAKKMFADTGCDAITIARGAFGSPWIFEEIHAYLKYGRKPNRPALREILKILRQHLKLGIEFYGERIAIILFRKFVGWYLKGHPHIKSIRNETSSVKTKAGLEQILKKCLAE